MLKYYVYIEHDKFQVDKNFFNEYIFLICSRYTISKWNDNKELSCEFNMKHNERLYYVIFNNLLNDIHIIGEVYKE